MPDGSDAIDRINGAAVLLDQHGFAEIAECIRGSAEVFEAVSGQANARGHSIRREAAYQRRNAALREAASAWQDLSSVDRAKMLATTLRRYHGTVWPRDRCQIQNPYDRKSLRFHLFEALRSVDRVPQRRQLAKIIG